MAKAIKFNLICEGRPIRTVCDLKENFYIEDVLNYYKNGLLEKWLDVRDYEQLPRIQELKKQTDLSDLEIAKNLVEIFGITEDENEIIKDLYIFEFKKQHDEIVSKYEKNNLKEQVIIENYKKEYKGLIDDIINNSDNISKVKANIEIIASKYGWVFDLGYNDLFWKLRSDRLYLPIMCLLMNEKTRKYFIPESMLCNDEGKKRNVYKVEDGELMFDDRKDQVYDEICIIINESDFDKRLGNNLIIESYTADYYKNIAAKEKRFMIISLGSGAKVRSAGIPGDFSAQEIRNRFVILEGIDIVSKDYSIIKYMEV